jgi:hypothetical protein
VEPARAVRLTHRGVRVGVSRIPPATTPRRRGSATPQARAPRAQTRAPANNAAASPAPTAPTARHTTADSSTAAIIGFCTFRGHSDGRPGSARDILAASLGSSAAARVPRRLKDMQGPLRDAIGACRPPWAGRFGDLTQPQIGARLGLSQMPVSRLLVSSLTTLRTRLDAE